LTVSRSTFLRTLATAGLGSCLNVGGLRAAASVASVATDAAPASADLSIGPASMSDVTAAHFRSYVGDPFTIVTSASERHVVTLAEVAERPVSRGVQQFSLIFHARPDVPLEHGIHAFSHPRLGALDIFIVPIGQTNRRRRAFQACFSRVQTSSGQRRT
jgi:hypothetical protein